MLRSVVLFARCSQRLLGASLPAFCTSSMGGGTDEVGGAVGGGADSGGVGEEEKKNGGIFAAPKLGREPSSSTSTLRDIGEAVEETGEGEEEEEEEVELREADDDDSGVFRCVGVACQRWLHLLPLPHHLPTVPTPLPGGPSTTSCH